MSVQTNYIETEHVEPPHRRDITQAGGDDTQTCSVVETLFHVIRNPRKVLIERWNWKSALFSSLCRAAIVFFANLHTGLAPAVGAMNAEFAYRALTAGLYGALTQAFRAAEPKWLATVVVMLGVPIFSHTIEFTVHWMRGTPDLRNSTLASVCFTLLSTLFNLHAMRGGVLVVGAGGNSLWNDVKSLPGTIRTFLGSGFGLVRYPSEPRRVPELKTFSSANVSSIRNALYTKR
jgi:hypothetical protein